jgi:hypothetical protein
VKIAVAPQPVYRAVTVAAVFGASPVIRMSSAFVHSIFVVGVGVPVETSRKVIVGVACGIPVLVDADPVEVELDVEVVC